MHVIVSHDSWCLRSQLCRCRDMPVSEVVEQPATLGSDEAVTSFVVDIIIGAPFALTGTCTGHLQPAAVVVTSSLGRHSKGIMQVLGHTLLSTRLASLRNVGVSAPYLSRTAKMACLMQHHQPAWTVQNLNCSPPKLGEWLNIHLGPCARQCKAIYLYISYSELSWYHRW